MYDKYTNKMRHERIKKGLCPRCGKKMDRQGYYCIECNDKQNEYSRQMRQFCREHHRCTECRKNTVYGNDRICYECRAKKINYKKPTPEQKEKYAKHFSIQQKELREERLSKGLCPKCGKRPIAPNKKKCEICLKKNAENQRRLRAKNMRKEKCDEQL